MIYLYIVKEAVTQQAWTQTIPVIALEWLIQWQPRVAEA